MTTKTICPRCQGRRGRIVRPTPPTAPCYELWQSCGACLGTGTVEDGQAKRAAMLDPVANARAVFRSYLRYGWTSGLVTRTIPPTTPDP